MELKNFDDLVSWLTVGGGAAIISKFVLDLFPAYESLESKYKNAISLLVSMVIVVASGFLVKYIPQEVKDVISNYLVYLLPILVTWGGQQVTHNIVRSWRNRNGNR